MRVTVLGMGSMGRAFAGRALHSGHQVTVWNRTRGRADELVSAGAVEAASIAGAVAGADVVLVVVADDAALLGVCLGHDGALQHLDPAAVLVNCSTVAPDTIRRVADALHGDRVVDAPVLGSPDMVVGGGGRFFVGCPIEVATALEPLWTDLGAGYTHCGAVGTAATMKLVSNLLLITGVAALAEGIATARSQGIPDELVRTVLSDSPVVSLASAVRLDSLLDSAHPGWFSATLARKDLRLAIDLAEHASVGVRLGPASEALLTDVVDAGGPWPDFTAIIEALT
jgi:3-hydroxyisobutyrate dehydrogenase-like beta-hydroxyacid dehydrogenase